MAFGTRVGFDPVRTLAFGGISGTYAALGTPLTDFCRILKIVNDTNAGILLSFNGTTDQDYIPMKSFTLYDFTSDKVRDDGFFLSEDTQLWAKQASGAPSSGSLYAIVISASAGGV